MIIAREPGIRTPRLRALTGMGRGNLDTVIMNARRKLAERGIEVLGTGKPARWRLSVNILDEIEGAAQ